MYKPRIIIDRDRYFCSITIRIGKEKTNGLPLACHALCEQNLKRPHLTCLWCRPRRVHYKKMPSKFPVEILVLTVNTNQKHKRIKTMIRKFLLTLTGWTLN